MVYRSCVYKYGVDRAKTLTCASDTKAILFVWYEKTKSIAVRIPGVIKMLLGAVILSVIHLCCPVQFDLSAAWGTMWSVHQLIKPKLQKTKSQSQQKSPKHVRWTNADIFVICVCWFSQHCCIIFLISVSIALVDIFSGDLSSPAPVTLLNSPNSSKRWV